MRILLAIIAIAVTLSSLAHADITSTKISEATALKVLADAANKTNPLILEQMRDEALRFGQTDATSPGIEKVSYEAKKTVFLTCAMVHAALVYGLRTGICVDQNRKVYYLYGPELGVSAGGAVSLVFGVVKTSTGNIRGTYKALSAGAAGKFLGFARKIPSIKPGIGVDLLVGKGPDGSTILLVGPSYGPMVDFAGQVIQIQ